MPKKVNNKPGKQLLILDADGTVRGITTIADVKSQKNVIDTYGGVRLIQITGKQFQVILSVSYKVKDFAGITPQPTMKSKAIEEQPDVTSPEYIDKLLGISPKKTRRKNKQ